MGTVLYVKANPSPTSRSIRIADAFIEAYQAQNPADEIITLDLYKEDIRFLTGEDLALLAPGCEKPEDHPVLKYTYQFLNADKYVFATPFWNLSIPAILKAYLDYVCFSGVTFKYTEHGPVGLCSGKVAHITARGGEYSTGLLADWEMGDRYMRTILGFLGLTDFQTIAAEGLDIVGADVEGIVNEAIEKAKGLAVRF
ncbi:MAG TPA: FMN-dependent NADH-azoreductase [Clostridiales bacterium]|jgi:FMN-dependent NADH-azoreductase|nr:FMN-dependent NADH-azoreductase [Clostridiales bacterium]